MLIGLFLAGCDASMLLDDSTGGNKDDVSFPAGSEVGTVTRVIDGDTIDVDLGDDIYRVRYVGANTPERDEACYAEAVRANKNLVEGQRVTLVRDTSDTDQYDRLLRYVYVGSTFVNERLIRDGWAEVVLYQPDDANYESFRQLERDAARANRGCHPTGIFDDGSDRR
jgi:micrococcal nuclease